MAMQINLESMAANGNGVQFSGGTASLCMNEENPSSKSGGLAHV
jgi:hypothetical protein